MVSEIWWEYDNNGNLIHSKYSFNEYEDWYEYDENSQLIHYKDTDGLEIWQVYDNNTVYYKDSNGNEFQYDSNTDTIMPGLRCKRFKIS